MSGEPARVTLAEWHQQAELEHGKDRMKWRFKCPSCGHEAAVEEWKAAGAPQGAVAFSCLGRYMGEPSKAAEAAFKRQGGPCNYTSGGLFVINTLMVRMEDGTESPAFEVAEALEVSENRQAA